MQLLKIWLFLQFNGKTIFSLTIIAELDIHLDDLLEVLKMINKWVLHQDLLAEIDL